MSFGMDRRMRHCLISMNLGISFSSFLYSALANHFFSFDVLRHPCEGKVNVVSDLSLRISGTSFSCISFHLIAK